MTSIRDRGLRNLFPSIIADNKITEAEVGKLIESAKDGSGLAKTEKKDLQKILKEHGDKFDPAAKAQLEAFIGVAPTPPPTPPGPVDPGTLSNHVSTLTDLSKVADTFKAEVNERGAEFQDPQKAFGLFAEYAGKLKALGAGQDPKTVDAQVEKLLNAGRQSPARGFDAKDTDFDTVSDLAETARGTDINKFDKREMAADHKVWTTTYWPMAGSGDMDQAGSAGSNLWAKEGPLGKLDKLLVARGQADKAKALEFERKPALNWLIGDSANKGEFIPNSNLSERDAEYTTGVDFDGDGKISKGVKVDFLDSRGDFAAVSSRGQLKPKLTEGDKTIDLKRTELKDASGKITGFEFTKPDGTKLTEDQAKEVFYTHAGSDGKIDGSMSVGWWGSCDKVALAGILFKDPQKDSVTVDGVTFTKQDLRGLLTVLADSQAKGTDFIGNRYDDKPDILVLKDGRQIQGKLLDEVDFNSKDMWRWDGDYQVLTDPYKDADKTIRFRGMDGKEEVIKATDIKHVAREDSKDMAPAEFHSTMIKWLGEDKRPAAMDRDSGSHVWNYNFWKADLNSASKLSADDVKDLKGHNGPADPKNTVVEYQMDVMFGDSDYAGKNYRYWLETNDKGEVVNSGWKSENPDFLWRPSAFNDWAGANSRNPYVDPKFVKGIYDKFFDGTDG
ncbi:MAG: hypothetical protein ABIJ09_10670 [Pseudomonadota bacterium]